MTRNGTIGSIALAISVAAMAEEPTLIDPRTRDEDITGTTVSVQVATDGQNYEYQYAITAPDSNTSKVTALFIDISCQEQLAGAIPLDTPGHVLGSFGSKSADGKHVPLIVESDSGSSVSWGITRDNRAYWALLLSRGGTSTVTIKSPHAPSLRQFVLEPDVDTNHDQYDYSGVTEDDPTVPWLDDWRVTGSIKAPACPGEEPPPEETPRFDGTAMPEESAAINRLLSYEAPLRDRFQLPADAAGYTLTLRYGEVIDPASFSVEPNNEKLRRLFHPAPGTQETVQIPVSEGKNKLKLEIRAKNPGPGVGKDIDWFEARTPKRQAAK